MSTPLWAHQQAAVDKLAPAGRGALWMDMGCGKTRTALELLRLWGCRKVLILCPLKVVRVWPGEFEKHLGDEWQVAALDEGSVARRARQLQTEALCAECDDRSFAASINYDAIGHKPLTQLLGAMEWDGIVCDESHRLKAPDGKQSQLVAALAARIPHRLLLTGTPMPHSQLDVFGQWRILDAATFGSNWFGFQHTFAQMEQREVYIRGSKAQPGQKPPKRRVWTISRDADGQPIYRNTERLQAAIEPLCFRVTDAVLDLPPVVDEQVYCLLDPPALRVYQQLADDFCAELACGEIAASNHLSRLLRLSQVANGFGVDSLTGAVEELSSAKADLLADVLSDLPPEEPVVVFGRFHHDLDAIHQVAKAAGRGYHEVSGRINQLAAWQAGAGNLLGVQLQAGGVGVDLTRARYQVYFSLDFNLGNYLQTRKRIHRPGQTRSVTYIHLLAAGTVDEQILSALQQRRDVVTAVVDALQEQAGVLA